MEQAKKSLIPGYLGLAFVWFGIHVGPGTASGRQAAVFYLEFGKWGLIAPFLAMGILGICIYMAIEISRLAKVTSFKDFANTFFHPYETIFANIFEFTFLAVVGMSGGACVYTGAHLFDIYLGLPVWVGMLVIAAFTIFFSIYGAELVRASSSYMSIMILMAMVLLVALGLAAVGGPANAVANTSFAVASPIAAGWSAIVYASFQSIGVIASVIAVTDGLHSKSDSKKASIIGFFINAGFLVIMSTMLFGFPASIRETLPNYYVATRLGYPFLLFVYVIIVFLACVTNTIAFSHALSSRYGKFIKTEKDVTKKMIICCIMLAYVNSVSFFGLDAIVRVGFTYLGYSCLVTIILPLIVFGPGRIRQLKAKAGEA